MLNIDNNHLQNLIRIYGDHDESTRTRGLSFRVSLRWRPSRGQVNGHGAHSYMLLSCISFCQCSSLASLKLILSILLYLLLTFHSVNCYSLLDGLLLRQNHYLQNYHHHQQKNVSLIQSHQLEGTELGPKPKPYHPNRPFFNIGHMVNSIEEIEDFLDRGANAIETDIYFAPNATPVYTFHGYPCDCFRRCGERERVDVFLERLRAITTPANAAYDKRLLLILFDLKLVRISHSAKALAGQQFATLLLKHLYNTTNHAGSVNGSRIRSVISIGHVFDYDFVLGFQNELESHGKHWLANQYIGWDVGMNDPLFAIESMWKRLDVVTYNIWQGDGRSNCVSPFYNLGRLSQIVKRRDNPSYFAVKNYIRKVYQWTVDLTVNIRTALRSNVDAIITNHPERVWNVLREREFSTRYRMANYEDSPWERISTKPARPLTSSVIQKPTLSLKLMNGAGDMFDSLTKFLVDTLRNQSPFRYFYLSTYQQKQKKRYYLAQYRNPDADDGHDRIQDRIHEWHDHISNDDKNKSMTKLKKISEPTFTTRLISLVISLLVHQFEMYQQQQQQNLSGQYLK